MALFRDLQDIGVKSGYERYVLRLEPILEAMGQCGMPVSPERHAELTVELERALVEAGKGMHALIPDEVRAWVPKHGYKKTPKDAVEGASTTHGKDKETGEPLSAKWARRDFPIQTNSVDPAQLYETRWVKLLEWKPSRDGLIRYMRYKGHPVPADYKTGKLTTGEAELVRLAAKTHDFLYDVVVEYRQIGTILNNHMANWKPSANGRVHPIFYYDTGTGQLAARRPNVMNAPKHGEGGKKDRADRFRSMVVAQPGHTLLEFDYRSFHAQTLAFEAQDPDYLRLAKLDIHSYLTAHLVRHPDRDRLLALDDAELGARLAEIKKQYRFIRDYKAKRAILGYGFGMGYRKLYSLYREAFDSQADAKRVIDMLNGLFPRANKWRDNIRMKAHEQGYLLSRFGCIRWFWEVLRWSGDGWQSGGDDSEAAVAFLPANDAFCHIKDAMLRLDGEGWLLKAGLINQIHDALLFECSDSLVDKTIQVVATEMERPSDVLVDLVMAPSGLSVEVGVSRGKSWDKMEEITWKN